MIQETQQQQQKQQQLSFGARALGRLEAWQILEIAFALHVAAAILILLFIQGDFDWGSFTLYMSYGEKLLQGLVPYRDFALEYPPIATVLFAAPLLFGHTLFSYQTFFSLEMILFDWLNVAVGLWAIKNLVPGIRPWGVLIAQPLLLILAGKSIILQRFDLAPAALTLLAIVLWAARKERLAWLVLGLATGLKLYPILVAPLFVLFSYKRQNIRTLALASVLFIAAAMIPNLIVTRGDFSFMTQFVAYHADRGLEIETLYSTLLMLNGLITGTPLAHVFQFGSEELAAPLAPLFLKLALPFTALGLLAVYFIAWRYARHLEDPAEIFEAVLKFSAVLFICFMLLGKVLSPQYLVWLYPLAGVIRKQREQVWLWLGSALFLSLWIFPYHWSDLTSFTSLAVVLLYFRNMELAILAGLLLWPYIRGKAIKTDPKGF